MPLVGSVLKHSWRNISKKNFGDNLSDKIRNEKCHPLCAPSIKWKLEKLLNNSWVNEGREIAGVILKCPTYLSQNTITVEREIFQAQADLFEKAENREPNRKRSPNALTIIKQKEIMTIKVVIKEIGNNNTGKQNKNWLLEKINKIDWQV